MSMNHGSMVMVSRGRDEACSELSTGPGGRSRFASPVVKGPLSLLDVPTVYRRC